MTVLSSIEQFEEIMNAATAVLYKHSTRCHISGFAMREMENFVLHHPDIPVYFVKVLEQRTLTQYITERTNIKHESPQVIVIRHGKPVWNGSHEDVTEAALAKQVLSM